jgi:hypothetical protein
MEVKMTTLLNLGLGSRIFETYQEPSLKLHNLLPGTGETFRILYTARPTQKCFLNPSSQRALQIYFK